MLSTLKVEIKHRKYLQWQQEQHHKVMKRTKTTRDVDKMDVVEEKTDESAPKKKKKAAKKINHHQDDDENMPDRGGAGSGPNADVDDKDTEGAGDGRDDQQGMW